MIEVVVDKKEEYFSKMFVGCQYPRDVNYAYPHTHPMIGEEQNLASTDKNSLDLGSHQRICAKFIIGYCLEQSQIVDNNRSKVQSTIQDIRIEAVNKLRFENL
jgi:hypothetical protein